MGIIYNSAESLIISGFGFLRGGAGGGTAVAVLVGGRLDLIPNNALATFFGVSGIDFTHLSFAGRPTRIYFSDSLSCFA